ncbi:MAG: prenyltransferase/squalene oxidase repeat-containing protein [Planctomycetaceae bacterium]
MRLLFKMCVCLTVLSSFFSQAANAQDPTLRFGVKVPVDVQNIYDRGLKFLADSQGDNGAWHKGVGGGHSASGSGVTGMAVMVFLASGEDPNFGPYSKNIRRALQHMISSQDARTGYVGGSMYHHGFAMLGLSEAYGIIDDDLLWSGSKAAKKRSIGEALELAVRCAVTSQKRNQWGGWRYGPTDTSADTSVAGAVLMGLLAARNAGIEVPDKCTDKALDYFKKMTSKHGTVGYSGGAGGFGGSKNLQAIACLVYSIGKRKDWTQFKAVLKSVQGNIEHTEGSYPFYYRYYMAQALFQADFEGWKRWNRETIQYLKDMQAENGSFRSSHGETYGTAMSLLALALNYRFLPIYER